VLLDTEGIDAYDQTAQYSTQIFSLAVLLSCLFVYNHMGGIDESALDRLSLVTEMTKHIRCVVWHWCRRKGWHVSTRDDMVCCTCAAARLRL
jgi:hypothetical protein